MRPHHALIIAAYLLALVPAWGIVGCATGGGGGGVNPPANANSNANSNGGPFTLTLNVNNTGAGTVEVDPPGGPYDDGTEVTLTATPQLNYAFAGFSGDLDSNESSATITMSADRTVHATFVGNLFVATYNKDRVFEFNGATGAFVSDFSGGVPFGLLQGPIGLAFAPNDKLLVASKLTDTIVEYAMPKGGSGAVFASHEQFESPRFLVFGPNGNLFATDSMTDQVGEFDPETGAYLGAYTTGGGLDGPRGLAFRDDGSLLVANADANDVVLFEADTGAYAGTFGGGGTEVGPSLPGAGSLNSPDGLTLDAAGNLLVASRDPGRIVAFDGQTGAYLGVFAEHEGLIEPIGLVIGPNGNLFVSDRVNHDVLEFDGQTGAFVRVFLDSDTLPDDQKLSFPSGLAFKPLP